VLAIRHLLQPLIAFGLARWFGLSSVQTTVLLAFSALPTASSCYVLAARMGYNGAVCGRAGHAVDPAGRGQPAIRAGLAA
jgi:predicted permease